MNKQSIMARLKTPWMIRKIIYSLATLAMLILTIGGIITTQQYDTAIDKLDIVVPMISALVAGMAAKNTHQLSDRGSQSAGYDISEIINELSKLHPPVEFNSALSSAISPAELMEREAGAITSEEDKAPEWAIETRRAKEPEWLHDNTSNDTTAGDRTDKIPPI